mmetsp:Transcript_32072/g.28437  ORF Transcript_32072/g.28437 Transcript_32072/m.28437 type:complete len:110 (+) Transcript_32072:1408-1737(+)
MFFCNTFSFTPLYERDIFIRLLKRIVFYLRDSCHELILEAIVELLLADNTNKENTEKSFGTLFKYHMEIEDENREKLSKLKEEFFEGLDRIKSIIECNIDIDDIFERVK